MILKLLHSTQGRGRKVDVIFSNITINLSSKIIANKIEHLVGEISFLEGKDSLLDHENDRIRVMVAISLGYDINYNSSISCVGTAIFTDLFKNL